MRDNTNVGSQLGILVSVGKAVWYSVGSILGISELLIVGN